MDTRATSRVRGEVKKMIQATKHYNYMVIKGRFMSKLKTYMRPGVFALFATGS